MTDFDSRAFRAACGSFATGVAIITTLDAQDELVGFTANSFASISLDPPLVLFSLGREANCLPSFEEAGHFAINILAEEQRALSQRFADPAADKWRGVAYERWTTGAPILPGTVGSLDCRTEAVLDGGDHRVFLGRVVQLASRQGRPLLFFQGAYHALGDRLGEPPHPAEPPDGAHLGGVEPSFTA